MAIDFLTGGALGLVTLGIVMVVAAVTLSLGGELLSDFQADQVTGAAGCNATDTTSCGVAYNISGYGMTSLTTIGSKQNLLALVGVTIVIIGAIMSIFAFFGRNN